MPKYIYILAAAIIAFIVYKKFSKKKVKYITRIKNGIPTKVPIKVN